MQMPPVDRSPAWRPQGADLYSTGASGAPPVRPINAPNPVESVDRLGQGAVVREPDKPSAPDATNRDWTEVKLFPRLSAAFDDADTNHDNYVSYEEVREFAAKYRAERDRQKAAQAAQPPIQEAPAIQGAPLKAE